MTPEAAYEYGKSLQTSVVEVYAEEYALQDADPIVQGTEESVTAEDAPFALRGAAQFWRERIEALEARAAAIEATR